MARIVFDPSGTHLCKDKLKVRLNIYAAPTDKAYAQNYLYLPVIPQDATEEQLNDPDWIAALPHIWQLTPHLSVFVKVGADITAALLQQFVSDVFTPQVIGTIDDIMVKEDSLHLISPYLRNKLILSSTPVNTFDDQAKDELNALLKDFQYAPKSGPSDHIEPQSIDMGDGAIDRASQWVGGYTVITRDNPANGTGTIDTFEIWCIGTCNACEMGTFIDEGSNTLSTRDYETIGSVILGAKRTYTGLDCDVVTGDYLGCYFDNSIERDSAGTLGCWYSSGDHIPATSYSFVAEAADRISTYATGEETPPAPSSTPSRWIDNSINNDIDNSIANFVDGGRP